MDTCPAPHLQDRDPQSSGSSVNVFCEFEFRWKEIMTIVLTLLWWVLGIIGAAWYFEGQYMDVPGRLVTSFIISWAPVALLIICGLKFGWVSALIDFANLFIAFICVRLGWIPKAIQGILLAFWYAIVPAAATIVIML